MQENKQLMYFFSLFDPKKFKPNPFYNPVSSSFFLLCLQKDIMFGLVVFLLQTPMI